MSADFGSITTERMKTLGKNNSVKKLAVAAASTGAAVGAVYFALGNVIYDNFLTRKAVNKQMVINAENDVDRLYYPFFHAGAEWFKSKNPTKVKIVSPRGGYIHSEIIHAEKESDIWVIVTHGYTGSPEAMGTYGKEFYEMGFNCLFPHLCGHGKSENDYVAMGWHDRLDIIGWIDYIINENPNAKIILFGLSMGAATVMMTTGENLPENVVCAIEDCGYTSVWDECRVQLKEMFGLPTFPFLTAAKSATKFRAGYDIKEASALNQVRKSKTPTLFIHGDKDDFVPFWMQDMVYRAAACEKEKLIIPGAAHAEAAFVDPKLYFDTVQGFIKKYI